MWLGYADDSYVATRLLWFTGCNIESSVNAQRTLELYLKAYLVSKGEEVKIGARSWGHSLTKLGKVCSGYSNDFLADDVMRRLKFFERYFEFVRYPNDPGSPDDGSLIWLSFDSIVFPLDELVSFVRPRIDLTADDWKRSGLAILADSRDPESSFRKRALTDSNKLLTLILCKKTGSIETRFSTDFSYDKAGC